MLRAGQGRLHEALDAFRAAEDRLLASQPFLVLQVREAMVQQAADTLAPVIEGSAPVAHPLGLIQALLLDAAARDRLGEPRAAEAAVERALELAEPDGIVRAHLPVASRPEFPGPPGRFGGGRRE